MGVVGRAADEIRLGLDRGDARSVHPGDDALGLGDHFGADTVAGKQQKLIGCHAPFHASETEDTSGLA